MKVLFQSAVEKILKDEIDYFDNFFYDWPYDMIGDSMFKANKGDHFCMM